jgi:hypothetical protein
MMSEVATTKDFQERVFARIRDQIGELLSDEDLKRLVDSAMERAFFEPLRIKDNWGSWRTETPSFQKWISALVEERVKAGIADWIKANDAKIQEQIEKHAGQMLPNLMAGMFTSMAQANSYAFINELQNRGMLPR